MNKRSKWDFYKKALVIAIPIMIQNGITNFVSLLDNVMIGKVGTDQMSGVAISNQLLFVWYLCLFGAISGIGIFTAQLYGKGDENGVRYTVRLHIYISLIILVIGWILFTWYDAPLIRLYLHADSGIGDVESTFRYAHHYMQLMLIGLLPMAITQSYANVLKDTGETVIPMAASVAAVFINLLGNYILIYGKFGAPQLGVAGAAIATVISRFIEAAILVIWSHRHTQRFPFFAHLYDSLYVPKNLMRTCTAKSLPLLINETLWGAGQAALAQNYAMRGLSVVAAYNICSTIGNVFNVCFLAMGVAIGIIIGQELGKGNTVTVLDDALSLGRFSVIICLITSALMLIFSGVFPQIYNTSDDIRSLATAMIRVLAVCMPIDAYANALYFTLRSGGRTFITFIFDSCFSWVILVPVTYILVHFTGLSILVIYTVSLLLQLIKCIIGSRMVHKGIWIRNLTAYSD